MWFWLLCAEYNFKFSTGSDRFVVAAVRSRVVEERFLLEVHFRKV